MSINVTPTNVAPQPPAVVKPLYIASDGIFAVMADGSITNIGGVAGPYFTVGGRGLLFEDGTSTAGDIGISLQSLYEGAVRVSGVAKIKMLPGGDFILADATDDSIYFKVEGSTGKVTITGDLEVIGNTVQIDTVIQDSDHWLINPAAGTTTPLKIEPQSGVSMLVDLVTIRAVYGGTPVFRIDNAGNVTATQNLTVGGLINGVDIAQLQTDFTEHVAGTGFRHTADQIDIAAIPALPAATTVQQALEQIEAKVTSNAGLVTGFEFVQTTASDVWAIAHNANTMRVVPAFFDDTYQLIIPDSFQIIDANNVQVKFSSPISGRAMLTLF